MIKEIAQEIFQEVHKKVYFADKEQSLELTKS